MENDSKRRKEDKLTHVSYLDGYFYTIEDLVLTCHSTIIRAVNNPRQNTFQSNIVLRLSHLPHLLLVINRDPMYFRFVENSWLLINLPFVIRLKSLH